MRVVKLKEICDFQKGETGLAKAEPGDYPLVTTGAERKTCNSFQFDTRAVCIPLVSSTGHGHASLKNVHYQEGKFALGTILVALTANDAQELNIQFLHLYLSQLKDQILVPLMSGAANVALSVTKIKGIEIPLPSIERQTEIVEQFKSIATEESELKDELTHQQTLLKKLRQQILQEAIEGKLTANWRAENLDVEPASELLKRIAAEKAELIKAKKIKKQKALPPISDDEKPFELPKGWEWCRVGDLTSISSGKGFTKSEYTQEGVRLFQIANVSIGKTSWETTVYLPESYLEEHPFLELKSGDIVMALNRPLLGGRLKVATLSDSDVPSILYQRVGRMDVYFHDISKWLYLYLTSTRFSRWLYDQVKGVNIPFVNQTKVYTHLMPIPSLLEQQAIATKVAALLDICDQLETQITQNQSHADALMQAVLLEAFTQGSPEAANA
ncbi:MAG: restriction endonuclease subunit S [Amphritea sp.]|nr:restriction endonuclease subunit S [Amphritea sp.]